MMTFVNMESEGMTILPTHRVVFGLKDFDESAFLRDAQQFFDVKKLDQRDPSQLMDTLTKADADATAFIAVTRGSNFLLVAREDAINTALAAQPARQRQLDIVRLHSILLERVLGITPEAIREQQNLRYFREAGEAIEQVISGNANVAFLTTPVSLSELRDIAFAGEVMPQKSTDFYPKLLSGLTVYALE